MNCPVLCSTVYIEINPPHSPLHSQLVAGQCEANFEGVQAICKPRRINTSRTRTKQATLKSLESALTEKAGGGCYGYNPPSQPDSYRLFSEGKRTSAARAHRGSFPSTKQEAS